MRSKGIAGQQCKWHSNTMYISALTVFAMPPPQDQLQIGCWAIVPARNHCGGAAATGLLFYSNLPQTNCHSETNIGTSKFGLCTISRVPDKWQVLIDSCLKTIRWFPHTTCPSQSPSKYPDPLFLVVQCSFTFLKVQNGENSQNRLPSPTSTEMQTQITGRHFPTILCWR